MEERNYFLKYKYCKIISELNIVIKKMVVPLALMNFITMSLKETLHSMSYIVFAYNLKSDYLT